MAALVALRLSRPLPKQEVRPGQNDEPVEATFAHGRGRLPREAEIPITMI